jgi:hypothetical protein
LVGSKPLSHVGSHLGLVVLKSQKMAAFSSPPALGARGSGTMLVYVTSGVDQISKFSWRGALRIMLQMCLEQAVLTSFKMAWGGVEGRRKVPEVLLFGDLRELAYKAIFKMP